MGKKAIEYFRWQLGECWWYSKEDEEIFDELVQKAQAFDAIIETYKNRFGAEDALAKHIVFEEVENAYMESGDRS